VLVYLKTADIAAMNVEAAKKNTDQVPREEL